MGQMDYIQSFFKSAGANACYALSLIDIARDVTKERKIIAFSVNEEEALIYGIEKGYIDFNKNNYDDTHNFYVKRPDLFMEAMTGSKWSVRIEGPDYKCQEEEYEILFWALNDENAKKGIGHFTRPGKNSLQTSNTVKNGKVYSKRIFKKLK